MKNVISDKVLGLQPSGIRKFFDIVSEMDDVISLGVGEPDFDTPWHIRDEGIYSLERGRTFYTSNAGLKELREEICRYLSRRCKVDYTIDETLITPFCVAISFYQFIHDFLQFHSNAYKLWCILTSVQVL